MSRIPSRQKGRTRRHERGTGSDGRERICLTGGALADGEVVWSWHPWAGVKSCGTFRKATVTNKVMDTGESTKQR
jgi:hypothetical protein